MATWTTQARFNALPEEVLDLLTRPEAIRRWAPVPFEIVDIDSAVLRAGSRARVAGNLGGYQMTFEVEVHEASPHTFGLTASGPIMIDANYDVQPADDGSRVLARVSVRGKGLRGSLLKGLADTLLRAGALRHSLLRMAREVARASDG